MESTSLPRTRGGAFVRCNVNEFFLERAMGSLGDSIFSWNRYGYWDVWEVDERLTFHLTCTRCWRETNNRLPWKGDGQLGLSTSWLMPFNYRVNVVREPRT